MWTTEMLLNSCPGLTIQAEQDILLYKSQKKKELWAKSMHSSQDVFVL